MARAGSTFLLGEVKIRPGTYVRSVKEGEGPLPIVRQGIVGAVIRSTWGPLGEAVELSGLQDVDDTVGVGGTTELVRQALRGGARRVMAVRAGAAANRATRVLADTQGVPVNVVTIEALHPGTRANGFTLTLRDALSNTSQRELLVQEAGVLLQTVRFAKGGANEADALVAAVAASDSPWITATRTGAGGDGAVLAAVANAAMAGGTDPAVDGAAYTSALTVLETQDWNVLAVDTEEAAIQDTVSAYLDRVVSEGLRVIGVLGEATSVALATRLTNAKAFNSPYVVYVANGFRTAAGAREGYQAAARLAGMIAGSDYTASLTNVVVDGATEVVGALTNSQVEDAILSGAVVFTLNGAGQVRVEYGITTLVTPGADQDDGWKKIRRVRERHELITRISLAVDPMRGQVDNDPRGRAAVVSAMQGVLDRMVREGALLAGARAIEDPSNPPQGDQAWFAIAADDVDAIEKIYATFTWRFTPPATSAA